MATTVVNRVTYFNIGGGGQRTCSSLYMNSGGSRKTISSAYGNISGSRKQIFPYSETTIYTYTWEEWSYDTYTSDPFDYVYNAEEIDGDQSENFAYPTFYYSKTGYYGSGNTLYLDNPITGSGGYGGNMPNTPASSPFYVLQGNGWGAISSQSHSSFGTRTHIMEFYKTKNGIFALQIIYAYYQGSSTTHYTQGSTYYGTVSSTNRDAYPDNGYSSGYWYVYQGQS